MIISEEAYIFTNLLFLIGSLLPIGLLIGLLLRIRKDVKESRSEK